MENEKLGACVCASDGFHQLGLTKREYFAGLVLQGLMANNREEVMTQNEEQLAKWAINHADELLKQLESK